MHDRDPHAQSAEARILTVADWTVDPAAVVAACRRRAAGRPTRFTLVVPAWLHGLDWAGDPAASVPCAQRQLDKLAELCGTTGLDFDVAGVGDPDVISAIVDALDGRDATEIVLFGRGRRFGASHPFDLVHRARRATALPTRRIALRPVRPRGRHGRQLLRGGGHCQGASLVAP